MLANAIEANGQKNSMFICGPLWLTLVTAATNFNDHAYKTKKCSWKWCLKHHDNTKKTEEHKLGKLCLKLSTTKYHLPTTTAQNKLQNLVDMTKPNERPSNQDK